MQKASLSTTGSWVLYPDGGLLASTTSHWRVGKSAQHKKAEKDHLRLYPLLPDSTYICFIGKVEDAAQHSDMSFGLSQDTET